MMKQQNRQKIFLFGLFVFAIVMVFWQYDFFERNSIDGEHENIKMGTHQNRITQSDLVVTLPLNKKENIFQNRRVLGGVVPHHLVAASSVTEFFLALSKSKTLPKTIIIIGPNHEERGVGKVITGKYAWDTSFGKIAVDEVLVDELVKNNLAVIDDEALESEHAIYSLTMFVKYFLPDVKIVPLALSARLSVDDAQALGKRISQMTNNDVVAVGSIDFSHYLPTEISNQKDQETLDALSKRDYPLIASFGNDHLDSPNSLLAVTSFVVEKSQDKYQLEVIRHTNSGLILGEENAPGTSHFELGFVLIE